MRRPKMLNITRRRDAGCSPTARSRRSPTCTAPWPRASPTTPRPRARCGSRRARRRRLRRWSRAWAGRWTSRRNAAVGRSPGRWGHRVRLAPTFEMPGSADPSPGSALALVVFHPRDDIIDFARASLFAGLGGERRVEPRPGDGSSGAVGAVEGARRAAATLTGHGISSAAAAGPPRRRAPRKRLAVLAAKRAAERDGSGGGGAARTSRRCARRGRAGGGTRSDGTDRTRHASPHNMAGTQDPQCPVIVAAVRALLDEAAEQAAAGSGAATPLSDDGRASKFPCLRPRGASGHTRRRGL